MRYYISVLAAIVVCCGVASPATASIGVWGITNGLNNDSLTAPGLFNESLNSTVIVDAREADVAGNLVYYRMEDRVGSGGTVGPRYGGQQCDVEFLGVIITGDTLQIGVISGHRISTSSGFSSSFDPGDLRITTVDGKVYGIEVGAGGGLGSLGATYKVDTGGNATAVRYSNGSKAGQGQYPSKFSSEQTAGSIWSTEADNWVNGTAQLQTATTDSSQLVGYVDSYSYTNVGTRHALIELSLDWSLLGQIDTITWTMACNNDVLGIRLPTDAFPPPEDTPVPEPASVLLWTAFGGLSLVFGWRRRRSAA